MSVPNIPQQQAVPQSAPSNDDQIRQLAQDFIGEITQDEDTSQLDPNQKARPPEQEAAPEVEADAEAPEQEAETPAQPEIPLVEVDIDGEKFTIPEKVKHRVMADKDYRQKTMEVAATKKQLEQHTATAQKLFEQAQQLAPLHAQLYQLDARAQQLRQALGSQELQADPLQYNRVQGELAILLQDRAYFAQDVGQKVSQFQEQQNRLRAEKLALDAPKLYEEFPALKEPATRQKLVQYAESEGLPPEAMEYLNYSAAAARLLHKASLYDQMVKDQAASAAKLKEKTKTLPAAQSSRAPNPVRDDQRAREQWIKKGGKWQDMPSSLLRGK